MLSSNNSKREGGKSLRAHFASESAQKEVAGLSKRQLQQHAQDLRSKADLDEAIERARAT